MNIKRFDRIEFEVLEHAHPDGTGYFPNYPHKDRALLLMEEGVLVKNPLKNWIDFGWKLTKEGIEYHNSFMEKLRKRHNHKWKTNRDSSPEDYKEGDEYGDKIDTFAYSIEHHNGMECKKCGFTFCKHCKSEFDVKKCKEETPKEDNLITEIRKGFDLMDGYFSNMKKHIQLFGDGKIIHNLNSGLSSLFNEFHLIKKRVDKLLKR